MGFYIKDGNYYEGGMIPGSQEVPQRPSQDHYWEDGAWALDVARGKQLLGKIPTEVFIDTVFAAPSGASADYSWNRFAMVIKANPALVHKLPKGGYVAGTAAEVQAMVGWLLTHDVNWGTATPDLDSVITQSEHDAVLAMLVAYGVA